MTLPIKGVVQAICIARNKQEPLESVPEATAVAGMGLEGDRYGRAEGSFSNDKRHGNRQVTLISAEAFEETDFEFEEARRNVVVSLSAVELLVIAENGLDFQIGTALLRAVGDCPPCNVPSNLSGKPGFKERFEGVGGIYAEVLQGGDFEVDSEICVV